MALSTRSAVYMLLTLNLSPLGDNGVTPFTPEEMAALAGRLDINRPDALEALYDMSAEDMRYELGLDADQARRASLLLERKYAFGNLVDDCADKNTQIITPFEREYPARLRDRLGLYQSPVLFVKGEISLLEGRYVGVTGIPGVKTDADMRKGLEHLVYGAAINGFGLITGEDAGVCRLASGFALESDSRLVCVLTGGLYDFANDNGHLMAIENGNLLAVSCAHPAAKPAATGAARRNSVIFSLASSAFVITTDLRRGETEAAKKSLCDNLYVYTGSGLKPNEALKQKGYTPVSDLNALEVGELATKWTEPTFSQMSFL